MDDFFRELGVRAATIDELLGPSFEALPAAKARTDLSSARLASWCRASTNGDWEQFGVS